MHKKELFLNKINSIYPENFESITTSLNSPRLKTYRKVLLVNSTSSFADATDGPFPNSFICKSGSSLSDSEACKSHSIYIQGLASMIPAILAKCSPGDLVLDLCAAPGSKSSQIANETNDEVHITCIENNTARIHALKENFEEQNVHNYDLVKTDASKIQYDPTYWGKFDVVLADVPCSNEGNIRLYDDRLLGKWNPKLAKKISSLQKRILASGIKSLKRGGRLIYSTCTYSVEENEEVVDWALRQFKEIVPEDIHLPITNVSEGKSAYGKKIFHPDMPKTKRILPTDLFDGFFVAALLKL